MVSVSGLLQNERSGFDPHSGHSVVSLSKIGYGSTHFMTDPEMLRGALCQTCVGLTKVAAASDQGCFLKNRMAFPSTVFARE